MLLKFSSNEIKILSRGFAVLVAVIVLGVAVAEHQLNNLTRRHDYVQSFNIRRDSENYSAYVLGGNLSVPAVYPLAKVSNTSRSLTLQTAGFAVMVPTIVTVDMTPGLYWLEQWRGQFVDKAYTTKKELTNYGRQFQLFYRQIVDEFRR